MVKASLFFCKGHTLIFSKEKQAETSYFFPKVLDLLYTKMPSWNGVEKIETLGQGDSFSSKDIYLFSV